jgi:CDP-diacylglycerol--glycerol-3-phosphate 3-phosphatidyltransferase
LKNNSGRIFTISNFFSFARVLLAWPAVHYLLEGTNAGNIKALVLLLFAALTDFLDGYFARKLDQRTDVGRIIDPLADKIVLGAVTIVLVLTHDLPLWFLILIIARDLVILLLGALMVSRTKHIPESNWPGKTTVTALAIVIIAFILSLDPVKWYLLYVCVGVLLISMYSYLRRFIAVMF